jgi:hypothetical protein
MCDCGHEFSYTHKNRHLKSKFHLKHMPKEKEGVRLELQQAAEQEENKI